MATLKELVGTLKVPYLELIATECRGPFKVLVSCILSLRTQDSTTARASERLFTIAGTPSAVALLPVETIEKTIYPVGFYRVKAAQIKEISERICREHGGEVPDTMEKLLEFKGVGRKTANLVLTRGFGKYGICVDTHVHRITNRWGLVNTKNPRETEFALRKVLPTRYWIELNGCLVAFGQGVCRPVSPRCASCPLIRHCRNGNGRTNIRMSMTST